MQDALQNAIPNLTSVPRRTDETDEDVAVRLTAVFFDRVGSEVRADGFDAQEVLMYMAEALWDIDSARNNFLAQRAEDSARESKEETVAATGQAVREEAETEEELSGPDLTARDLNRNFDRQPAVKGMRTPSKLVLSLKQPEGNGDKVATFRKYNQGADLSWARGEHIRALNRWRNQVLCRELGEARPARIGFHPEEIQWLIDYHHQYKRDGVARDGVVNFHKIQWDDVTRAFHARFAGRILTGLNTPQPARTKPSLKTERYKIKAICDLVGLRMRNIGAKKGRSGGDRKEGTGPAKGSGKKR